MCLCVNDLLNIVNEGKQFYFKEEVLACVWMKVR